MDQMNNSFFFNLIENLKNINIHFKNISKKWNFFSIFKTIKYDIIFDIKFHFINFGN